ncbi:MAG: amidophosphoribosyltransferase [Armatimonadetes bacterium]|nr:amidophosphoribosyltransferase [Armatimonadota bacterium]
MKEFEIRRNNFVSRDIKGYYHVDYVRMGNPGNPDYLNVLKNDFGNRNDNDLSRAIKSLEAALDAFFGLFEHPDTWAVCVVPRAKSERMYRPEQQYFRAAVQSAVRRVGFVDGTLWITRHTDTVTTHLNQSGYGGSGHTPYVGITKATCHLSPDIAEKRIVLVDDIYTPGVCIDEDAIQALLDAGASQVVFYAVGKTVTR